MVGNQKVYDFIGELLASLKECFSSRSIHLGMDEAHMLGLGNYLKKNGYRKSSLLMKEHCEKVLNLCQDLDLEPMVWSDMYITSNTGKGYYDVDSSTDTCSWEKPDSNLGLVYWDYFMTICSVFIKNSPPRLSLQEVSGTGTEFLQITERL